VCRTALEGVQREGEAEKCGPGIRQPVCCIRVGQSRCRKLRSVRWRRSEWEPKLRKSRRSTSNAIETPITIARTRPAPVTHGSPGSLTALSEIFLETCNSVKGLTGWKEQAAKLPHPLPATTMHPVLTWPGPPPARASRCEKGRLKSNATREERERAKGSKSAMA